ncbi:tubulin monoglutamylase TTLL4-like [Ptychodera flava]|uniref:tubulin monoglutamylase TTLL4-like n=1 Tax=Ptychodera flava TaxID=63121 RepID=UPI00396A80A2
MASASDYEQLRASLQRGLENLLMSNNNNQKQLPLRQQTSRPVLKYNSSSTNASISPKPLIVNSMDSNRSSGPNSPGTGSYSAGFATPKPVNPYSRPISAQDVYTPQPSTVRSSHSTGNITANNRTVQNVNSFMKPKPMSPPSSDARTSKSTDHTQNTSRQSSGKKFQRWHNRNPSRESFTLKSEHGVRQRGDGSSKVVRTVRERPIEAEEWSDIDENEEGSEDDFGSERTPGDGASLDFGEEDDGIDGLEDDLADDDDESDGYSISSSLSRQSSTHPFSPLKRDTPYSAERLDSIANEIDRTSVGKRASMRLYKPMVVDGDEVQPALTPSLFSNIAPTINFITQYEKESHDWLGYWGKHMKAQGFKAIREYQKVNHFPGSFQIGRKDRLWRNLSKMQLHFGKKDFGFFPQTFVLPYDTKLLKRAWEDGGPKQKWILKPVSCICRGIGIKVIHKWSQIPRRRPVLVQRYLSKPFLINGSKFDLRIYVYVTSYDPLRIYVFEDGLVRFATMKYSSSMKSLSNKFMHLTNYSINKKNSEFTPNDDENICQGHKWSLKALWGYMRKNGIDSTKVWDSIKDIVVKTIICSEAAVNSLVKSNVRRRYCCHELFGFDVMLDENLKPWIIEVNISPSLHSNSSLDVNIKGQMMKDLLNLAGFQLPDKKDVYPNLPPNSASVSHEYGNVFTDKQLWNVPISKDERAKHAFYIQKHLDDQCRMTILDSLTPDDIRMLAETEDEYSRRGFFIRAFPNHTTHQYLRFFEQPRYYNILVDEWIKKYHRQPARGIALLEEYCREGIHYGPGSETGHVWTPVSSFLMVKDPRIHSAGHRDRSLEGKMDTPEPGVGIKSSSSLSSLPRLKRRLAKSKNHQLTGPQNRRPAPLPQTHSSRSYHHLQAQPPGSSSRTISAQRSFL